MSQNWLCLGTGSGPMVGRGDFVALAEALEGPRRAENGLKPIFWSGAKRAKSGQFWLGFDLVKLGHSDQ